MIKGRIHSTESFGTVDGPGVRYVVFFQGCPMRCQYCHNPDTWDFSGGREVTAEELMAEYESYKEFLKSGGITATGGEPLAQPEFLAELFRLAKSRGVHTCLDTADNSLACSDRLFLSECRSVTERIFKPELGVLRLCHIVIRKNVERLDIGQSRDVLPKP